MFRRALAILAALCLFAAPSASWAAFNTTSNVAGLAANNAAASGNPVLGSGVAQNAEPTAATNGQNAQLATDLAHKLIVSPYANKENLAEGTASATGTGSTSLVAAPGAGLYLYITHISCSNTGATAVEVSIQNGSGGTTIYSQGAAAGSGFEASFTTPIGGVNAMTANTALFFASSASTTTLFCNASGYKGS